MTTQEYQFCEDYALNGGNGNQAAIAAGYPEDEADTIAKALLKRADIRAELRLYKKPTVIDGPEYWKARAEFGQ
jgi:phage terminase small subunit